MLEQLLSFGNKLTVVLFEKSVQLIISRKPLKKKKNEFLKAGKDKTVISPSNGLRLSSCIKNDTLTIVPYRCPSLFLRGEPLR